MKKTTLGETICTPGGRALMIFLMYLAVFGIFGIIASIVNANPSLQIIVYIYVIVFAFFGWKALNRIQPSFFIVLPIIGWIVYFLLKFFLATLVGMFVTPFIISKKIVSSLQNKYTEESEENFQD